MRPAPPSPVGDVSVVEGNSGFQVVRVPIDLTVAPSTAVSVSYRVIADTAAAGDFIAKTGRLGFAAGSTSKTVAVSVKADTDIEGDETVSVQVVSVSSNATVADGRGIATIINDDGGATSSGVEASVGDATVTEAHGGTHIAEEPVTLSQPAPAPLTLGHSVACATAFPGSDFSEPANGSIAFAAGTQSKTIAVRVTADFAPEELEQVFQGLRVKSGPATIRRGSGHVIHGRARAVRSFVERSRPRRELRMLVPTLEHCDGSRGGTSATVSSEPR